MVAVRKIHSSFRDASSTGRSCYGAFHLIQGSLSHRKIARKFPILVGFHKASDGTLIGVLIVAALMTSFTLHWQHIWTVAFTRLEATRELSHRLLDSTAMLERHILRNTHLPKSMVSTKASNLVYLERPEYRPVSKENKLLKLSIPIDISSYSIHHGY